jgi:predicted nucleic acid-binding protein
MVVDTSIFIEFLRAKNKKQTQLFNIPDTSALFVSTVTLYELYMGATSTQKKNDIDSLTQGIPVLSFDEKVSRKAAEIYHFLRKRNKMIEFRDIFIAATSIVNEFPLLTLNSKHFDRISDLELINKYDLPT